MYIPVFVHDPFQLFYWQTQLKVNIHRGGVAQWVARLTSNVEVVGSSPIKGPVVSVSKKRNYPLLLSTGWSQERI